MIDIPTNIATDSSPNASGLTNSAIHNNITNNCITNLNRNNFLQNRSLLLQNLHSLHNIEPTPQDIAADFLYSPSNFDNQLIHIASQNIRGLSDATKQLLIFSTTFRIIVLYFIVIKTTQSVPA